MREFDSSGLSTLRKILQTSRGPPQFVDLQDELIQQVLGLTKVLRRDLSNGPMGGIFTAKILNTHAGSDTATSDVNPYTLGGGAMGAQNFDNGYFPTPGIPLDVERTDVWLLSMSANATTGAGDFGGGFAGLIYDRQAMGWRAGNASSVAVVQPLSMYDQEVTYGNSTLLSDGANQGWLYNTPIRVGGPAADGRIRFETVKAGVGAATYELDMLLGVFPASLGQDGQ